MTVQDTRHRWIKAPRSLLAAFICSKCGRDSMVRHYGRCSAADRSTT